MADKYTLELYLETDNDMRQVKAIHWLEGKKIPYEVVAYEVAAVEKEIQEPALPTFTVEGYLEQPSEETHEIEQKTKIVVTKKGVEDYLYKFGKTVMAGIGYQEADLSCIDDETKTICMFAVGK